MATTTQKITLSSSRDIPFNKLVLSQANVRRIKAGVSIEDLSVSIARRGLIQSLHVRPVLDAGGQETGMFEVPAGGRRYQALAILVKQKRLAKTAPVPCVVGDAASGILMEEISFAENDERVPPHPLDQYRAFQTMCDKGMTEEDIAAAFLIDVNVVKQRLRLASISPVLLDIYAEDGIELKQLMAFTVSQDHVRQEQVWAAIKDGWQKEPWQIRRMLTETAVSASDKRAAFVGIDAYEAAGGYVLRDLFEDDNGGWLQDPVLLDRMVGEKLKTIAEEIAGEGWKWVEIAVNYPYGHHDTLRKLVGTTAELTDEERPAREALRDEHDRLVAEYADADDLPDEIDQRLGEIERALDAFEQRPVIYDPIEIARAGVFVSIDRDGDLVVDRGYVRPKDEAPEDIDGETSNDATDDVASEVGARASIQRAVITIGGQPAEPDDDDDEEDVINPLPERLVIELTAHRSLALRDAVGANPHVALTALLHKQVRDTFQRTSTSGASLQATVNHVFFREQGKDLAETSYAKSVTQRHEDWKTDIPVDDDALWDWLAALDDTSRLALLAHCVAYGINALYERPNPHSATGISQAALNRRMAEADRLARSTGLDMVDAGFRPTVENYLGRVTKSRILAAVREGAGERAAQLIAHLKKGDMAVEAERLLADSGWLPEPLRLADLDDEVAAVVTAAEADGVGEALPDFLAGDDEDDMDDADEDGDQGAMIAAE
ncbi:ParB N-terminal domain-containing protein [Agrobacterium tumefaciens]|uniref:ParB/RepB/Spo0J family partition protein n=1 Tax=Agrobacterium tumefaciens TaxID=358 RepID=UPI0015731B27|nr:ParB/RepB/Spo0J family partition protein [Agrobacterium tumefaciens]NTA50656.1 ParB N-terminal domain-containing protein [Agrobacterium tumefaciens]